MKLHYYRKYDNCNFEFIPKQGNLDEEYIKSKICVDLIVDKKDGIISEIINELSKAEKLSAIIQILYAIYMMHKNGYYHFDTKLDNIFYNRTDKKNIKLGKFGLVPTFGYIFGLIDYGFVMHKDFDLYEDEREMIENQKYINYDLSIIINDLFLQKWKIYFQIDKDKTFFDAKEIYEIIKNMPDDKYKNIMEFIKNKLNIKYSYTLNQIKQDFTFDNFIKLLNEKHGILFYELVQILQIKYPKLFFKIICKIFNKKIKSHDILIDKKDLLYAKKHQHRLNKIIKRYINLLNE